MSLAETLARELSEERGRQKQVLLVEDNDSDAFLISEELREWGYAVTHVKTGQDALNEDRTSIDIAVIDLCLGPGSTSSGLDVAISLSENYHQMVIVICSGYSEAIKALPAAMTHKFIICEKPFKIGFLNRVGQAVNVHS